MRAIAVALGIAATVAATPSEAVPITTTIQWEFTQAQSGLTVHVGDAATLTITYESALVAPTGPSIVNFGTGAAPGSSFAFAFPGLTLTAANQFPLFGNSAPPNVLFVDGEFAGLQFFVLPVPQPFGFVGSTTLTIGSSPLPNNPGTFGTEFVFQSFGFPAVPIARGTVDFDAVAVPEPASLVLLGSALLMLLVNGRRFERGSPMRRVAEA